MKKLISFILAITLAIYAFPKDNQISYCYPIGKDINAILIDAPGRIIIFKGDCTGIRLAGNSSTLKYVTCTVQEGNLIIKAKCGMEQYLVSDRDGGDLKVYVLTPNECLEVKPGTKMYQVRKTKNGNHNKK